MEHFYRLYEKDGEHFGEVYHYDNSGNVEILDFKAGGENAADIEMDTMDYIDANHLDAELDASPKE